MTNFSDLGRLLRLLTRLKSCIRYAQRETFNSEINFLKQMQLDGRSNPLPKGPLRSLSPLVYPSGVLRVGGRVEHSSLPYHVKHPPILDEACHLAELIIVWAHARSLHVGFRSTYSYVLQRAWVNGGKCRIRHFILKCVVCVRNRSSPLTQLMANLPPGRVTPSRALARTGVEYAWPFHVLPKKGRGVRTTKIYVAAFVCMALKNIHLEPVGDFSTESLMDAVTRFIGVTFRGIVGGRCVVIQDSSEEDSRIKKSHLRRIYSSIGKHRASA
ncbi:uncharacterized protein LOC117178584 [Belonocnema kinseyi]|uniref:uncharacterized protein LOC117178584 n=1 Tax=Belonocnema kinseyi TaxID=2817044 RepID=UPI00143CF80B|nr:uncharacterized protein LOC117178584 [Belonocnema kinseyi]